MIAALPAWRYKDILTLPMPVVELAAEASNKRRDEQNKFLAAIHGIKIDDKKTVANDKSQVNEIKSNLLAGAGIKTATREEIQKAVQAKKTKAA